MGVDLDRALTLLRERAREYGTRLFLLYVLEADIMARRELEKIEKLPFQAKRSVEVERQRELTQAQIEQIVAEMDSLVTLIERIVRNEHDDRA